jgi:hypothetical protein
MRGLFGLSLACALAAWIGGASRARAELLPLACDDGASVSLSYVDSSPELEHEDELGECNQAPIGDWNRVGLVRETDVAAVDALGFVRSDDGFVLQVEGRLDLDVEDGFAALVVAVEGEARFRAPEADEDVPAEVIVEIARDGEVEEAELSLAVLGPGVDLFEDLDDEAEGELRFPLELEPDEDYRAVLIAAGALTDTGSGSQSLRLRVDVPAPEPSAPLLVGAGACVLGAAAARRKGRARSPAVVWVAGSSRPGTP